MALAIYSPLLVTTSIEDPKHALDQAAVVVPAAVLVWSSNWWFPRGQAYFQHDLPNGRIRARNRWGAWRVHPRPGYVRLEYSLLTGEIHEITAAGKRRKVPISWEHANQDQWRDFMTGFHPKADAPLWVKAPDE